MSQRLPQPNKLSGTLVFYTDFLIHVQCLIS